ncbi:hypothetical protein [Microbacterium tumbae]
MPLPVTLDVYDYDGILGLVDVAAYRQEVEWVAFDPDLVDHFTAELVAGRALVWQASPLGGADYGILLTDAPSAVESRRELRGRLTVTAGRLHVVNYTDLTIVTEEEGGDLPSAQGADWFVDVPDGEYDVTVRQLFDPEGEDLTVEGGIAFEIVLTPAEGEPVLSAPEELFRRTAP